MTADKIRTPDRLVPPRKLTEEEAQKEFAERYLSHSGARKYLSTKNALMGHNIPWCPECGERKCHVRKYKKDTKFLSAGIYIDKKCWKCRGLTSNTHVAWDDPRRCQAVDKKGRALCSRRAVKGRKYCTRHGGRRALGPALSKGSKEFVTRFYRASLGPLLTQRLKQVSKHSPKELIEIRDEVALAREAAAVYVEAFSVTQEWLHRNAEAYESPNMPDGTPKTEEQIAEHTATLNKVRAKALQTASLMMEAMKKVAEINEKAANIYMKFAETFDLEHIQLVVNQIIRNMYEVCGDEHIELAKRFEKVLQDQLRVPSTASVVSGSEIPVDQLLQNMANSLPLIPQEDQK